MDESNLNWFLAIAGLLIGIGIGALGYHLLQVGTGQRQKLRRRLAERDRELTALKTSLGEHFSEASRLVENLQRESEALAKHLALDAETLAGVEPPPRVLELSFASEGRPAGESEKASEAEPATPRDYADGSGGTLSEDYGLKRKSEESAEAAQPPRH